MPYSPALDQTQLGQETVWGTPVTATSKLGLISSCEIEPEIDVETIKDIRGSFAPAFVSVLNSHMGSATISGVPSYDDLPYILDSLLMTATPGAATTYARNYTAQLDSVPTRTKYTLIKGQTGKVQKLEGAIFNELTLKIESNKPWSFTGKLLGQAVSDGSLAALSDRTQTPIHANVTNIFVDAVGGTIGSTQIVGNWFSVELSIKDVISRVSAISSLSPTTYVDTSPSASLKFTVDVDTETAGYLTSALGTSPLQKQVRIKATTGSSQIAQFDFGGVFTKAPKVNGDKDGVATLDFEMDAIYNAALGNYIKASVTNSIATMV